MGLITNIWISFLAGLFAPLGAVCVLPLYPGFLAYLSGVADKLKGGAGKKGKKLAGEEAERHKKRMMILFSLVSILGIFISMLLVGFIFTFILQVSLTNVIGVISPIAFGVLGIVSILLIFDVDFGRIFPKVRNPVKKNPYVSALLFGLFFGLIVLPCNPASLVVLFAVSSSIVDFLSNLLVFGFFALGMGLPLLLLAVLSSAASGKVISFLTSKKRQINLVAGLLMLGISLYYLLFVFKIFG